MKTNVFLVILAAFVLVGCASTSTGSRGKSSITIKDIEGIDDAAVWIFEEWPIGSKNTALGNNFVRNNNLTLNLYLPASNRYNWRSNTTWGSEGYYYVGIVPLVDNNYQYDNAVVYVGDSNTPQRYFFSESSSIVLQFDEFKPVEFDKTTVTIENINSISRAFIWVFEDLPFGSTNTALRSNNVENNTLTVTLSPNNPYLESGWVGSTGFPWSKDGDYYVAIVPIVDDKYQSQDAMIYAGDSDTPQRYSFTENASIVLSFDEFKPVDKTTVTVQNITKMNRAGIWLFKELPEDKKLPINAALSEDDIKNNTLTVGLRMKDSEKGETWYTGELWSGEGDYYIGLVPLVNGSYRPRNAMIYTGNGNTPQRYSFKKYDNVVLNFSDFDKWTGLTIRRWK